MFMIDDVSDFLSSKRRDKVEIIASIIAMTQTPSNISRIMYKVRLNYRLVKKYLNQMIKQGLIEKIKGKKFAKEENELFVASQKGLKLLETYCEILKILYGERFLENEHILVVSCLKYCQSESD